jgi:hypothetical protein
LTAWYSLVARLSDASDPGEKQSEYHAVSLAATWFRAFKKKFGNLAKRILWKVIENLLTRVAAEVILRLFLG